MSVERWGFQGEFFLAFPLRPTGILLLGIYLFLSLLVILRSKKPTNQSPAINPYKPVLFLLLLISAPIASEILLFRFPAASVTQPPNLAGLPSRAVFSMLGALPWMVAGGFLNGPYGVLIGLASGIARGGWETHHLLTPLQFAAQAGLYSWLLRRDYVEWPGRIARRPILSALIIGVLFGFLRSLEQFAYTEGELLTALDFAISQAPATLLASILELGFSALIVELLKFAFPSFWIEPERYVVGPYNRSLAARLATMFVILGLSGGIVMLYGDWLLTRSNVQELLETQMRQTAEQAGTVIPFYVQTGRAQVRQMAARYAGPSGLIAPSSEELTQDLRGYPFFTRIAIFDPEKQLMVSAPVDGLFSQTLPIDFDTALLTASVGVPQELVTPTLFPSQTIQMVFLGPIVSSDQSTSYGVLAGWTDLATNPILLPVSRLLEDYSPGEAFVTNDRWEILLHQDPGRLLEHYEPGSLAIDQIRLEAGAGGSQQLVYTHQVAGYPWRVVVSIPAQLIQTLAISQSLNLVLVILGVGILMVLLVYLSAQRITQPLQKMAETAESIALGNLDQPVDYAGADEIGRLALSFEKMRLSLRSRLEEMNLLLLSNQQMTTSFELQEVLPPILGSVKQLTEADVVRLTLEHSSRDGEHPLQVFQAGEVSPDWEELDAQVLSLAKERGRFVLENPTRAKAVLDVEGLKRPIESLMAVPLMNEDEFVGSLWLGYRSPYSFSKDEVNLLSILAGQLGISVANASLFHRAEQERLRLSAVLESTPDAVIVTDPMGLISLANPAAESILDGNSLDVLGQPAIERILAPELVKLLMSSNPDERSTEFEVEDGRVYFASVTDIQADGQDHRGRVCVLWDVTHFKMLDSLKSEFVSTVSHDLRAPLTLMRGYATMLGMVGDINEEQKDFVRKILSSVDRMSRLVDNLLDLGRIEAGIGLSLEQTEVGTIVEDVVNTHRPQSVNKQLTIEVEVEKGMEVVEIDPTLIRQAIGNLVDNAIKYTQAGGEVKVESYQLGGQQVIKVRDTGLGIAPADQARLFEKFFRSQRKELKGERGSGLGLAIVKSIIEQHGGRIHVESRLGEGSTFTVRLPLSQPKAKG